MVHDHDTWQAFAGADRDKRQQAFDAVYAAFAAGEMPTEEELAAMKAAIEQLDELTDEWEAQQRA